MVEEWKGGDQEGLETGELVEKGAEPGAGGRCVVRSCCGCLRVKGAGVAE